MNSVSLLLSQPVLEGRRMDPIGRRQIIFFGEVTAVGMSAARSDQDYSYKTDFGIWRENQEFEHQNIPMSRPPLD